MAERGEGGGRGREDPGGSLDDLGLESLKRRLDELQHTVEELGRIGAAPPPEAHPAASRGSSEPFPAPPSAPTPPAAPAGTRRAPPSPAHPPLPGRAPHAPPARASETAILDAGPFDSLSSLHRYERDLGRLGSVAGARVRRFGHGRAEIELAVSAPADLTGDLLRLGGRLQEEAAGSADLSIDLLPPEGGR